MSDYQPTTPDYPSTSFDYQSIIHDYMKQHEQMLKQHNTKRIGYVYKGNKDWDYYYGEFSRMVRKLNMSNERKKTFNERLNTIHPQAKIDTIYIEHYIEGYPSEWSEKLL